MYLENCIKRKRSNSRKKKRTTLKAKSGNAKAILLQFQESLYSSEKLRKTIKLIRA